MGPNTSKDRLGYQLASHIIFSKSQWEIMTFNRSRVILDLNSSCLFQGFLHSQTYTVLHIIEKQQLPNDIQTCQILKSSPMQPSESDSSNLFDLELNFQTDNKALKTKYHLLIS